MCFDTKSTKKLPTRYQILQRLMHSKPFDQNENGHTFADFQRLAANHEEETPTDPKKRAEF